MCSVEASCRPDCQLLLSRSMLPQLLFTMAHSVLSPIPVTDCCPLGSAGPLRALSLQCDGCQLIHACLN